MPTRIPSGYLLHLPKPGLRPPRPSESASWVGVGGGAVLSLCFIICPYQPPRGGSGAHLSRTRFVILKGLEAPKGLVILPWALEPSTTLFVYNICKYLVLCFNFFMTCRLSCGEMFNFFAVLYCRVLFTSLIFNRRIILSYFQRFWVERNMVLPSQWNSD